MALGMEKSAAPQTVSMADLRTVIADRLQAAQRRMDPASATAAFGDTNNSQQDNMIGSLIFGMVCWAPFMEAFSASMNSAVAVAASSPAVSAVADGLSMIVDEKAYKNRRRSVLSVAFKDGIYHGGRKQAGNLNPEKVKRNFNLVAANENAAFAYDAQAEIAGMSEMLDMIDQLEKRGASLIVLEQGAPVSLQLRQAVANKSEQKRYVQRALAA